MISCDSNSLATASAPFQGAARDEIVARSIELYLSCIIAGVEPDPQALAQAAKCFCGIAKDEVTYNSVMTYLACAAVNK